MLSLITRKDFFGSRAQPATSPGGDGKHLSSSRMSLLAAWHREAMNLTKLGQETSDGSKSIIRVSCRGTRDIASLVEWPGLIRNSAERSVWMISPEEETL
ncbi:hypothetical protein [Rhizobium azibense]|uniref:hypothetical protein n=1 Tax=Rhizobium azibense TaxID=1136135 RepID=UPI00104DDBD0|nr:hypothetical protein [Rhizobium azibense]